MVQRGPYVSYANCGLPYHVGGVIKKESSLLVASEQMFRVMFAVDVQTNCEAISISPKNKTVDLRNVQTGEVTTESYDKLVLSPGAPSIHPPLPGIDLPGIFHVRTVPGAVNIPMGQLRSRLHEFPRDREIQFICRSAQRAYYATRILLQNGFKARHLSGGTLSRAMYSLADLIY
jgi:NADPH-dependent 2,4-dienoyl-CoA reductase/sulfur reductase-like enzyme